MYKTKSNFLIESKLSFYFLPKIIKNGRQVVDKVTKREIHEVKFYLDSYDQIFRKKNFN